MANRVVEILYSLKDKFTGQVGKITAGYKKMGDAGEKAADRLERSTKRVNTGFSGMLARLKSVRAGVAGLFAGIGFGTLTAGIKGSLSDFDELAKAADRVGVSTDALQELRFAADRTGIDTRTLDNAIQRFSRRMAEAAQGTGVLKKEFERLGISVNDQNGNLRSTESVLREYADAIAATEAPQEQLRLAVAAFDIEGGKLVNTLRDGAKGLDEYAAAAREAGQVVDEKLLRSAEQINDRYDELATTISLRFKTLAVSIANSFDNLAARFGKGSSELKNLQVQLDAAVRKRDLLERRGDPLSLIEAEKAEEEIYRLTAQIQDMVEVKAKADTALENTPTTGIDALRTSLEGATASAKSLYAETQKLFKEDQPSDPFQGLESTAAKTLKTYRLISAALSAAKSDPGSEESAKQVEAAAAAINKLRQDGEVAEITLQDMKRTLGEVFQAAPEQSQITPIIDVDKNQIVGYTDEATMLAQQRAKENPIIWQFEIDDTQVDTAFDSLEAKFKARAERMRSIGRSIGTTISQSLIDEAEKSGGLP